MASEHIRDEIELDEWIIMPNHIHGIIIITNDEYCKGDRPVARVEMESINNDECIGDCRGDRRSPA